MTEITNEERIKLIMGRVSDAIPGDASLLGNRAFSAAEYLVKNYRSESDESLATTLRNLLPTLLKEKNNSIFQL